MDMIVAGTAAAIAGGICNPLEVVKIRMQLQGELKARGKYAVHYKNVFHAFYTIATKDGYRALQKGVVPYVLYHFSTNAVRLGCFQMAAKKGLNKNADGSVNFLKTLGIATFCGATGGMICSPFYLIKTHLQSQVNEKKIAVGHQHRHQGTFNAFKRIYNKEGIGGLWRGTSAMIPRTAMTAATQISSYEITLEYAKKIFPGSVYTPLTVASLATSFFTTCGMAPFDVIATRFYNQGTDAKGKGTLYKSVTDCAVKMYREEGIRGFFKGWTACYFRLGPYTMITMILWDRFKELQKQYWDENQSK